MSVENDLFEVKRIVAFCRISVSTQICKLFSHKNCISIFTTKLLSTNPDRTQFTRECCKTPPSGGQKTQAFWLAPPKKSFVGYVSKPFSKHMWRPEM